MYDGMLDYDVISIDQTKDNNYVIAGWDDITHDIFLYKLSEKGEIIWKKYFLDGSCIAGSIIATNDDDYLICGYSNSFSEDHHYQTILIKTDSLGSNLSDTLTNVNNYKENIVFDYQLTQNYPNPFNSSTIISYQIPQPGFISLKVYDILGREVATLVNEEKPEGNYEVTFSGQGLPSGIYFYKFSVLALPSQDGQASNFVLAKKMVSMK